MECFRIIASKPPIEKLLDRGQWAGCSESMEVTAQPGDPIQALLDNLDERMRGQKGG